MVSAITNSSTNQLLHQSSRTSRKQQDLFGKLATGKRIQRASDDVVGSLKAESITSSLNALKIAESQADQKYNNSEVETGGLSANLAQLQNLREYAIQASNSTLSSAERSSIQGAALESLAGIAQTASNISPSGGVDFSSEAGATSAISALDENIQTVTSRISSIGSSQQALEVSQSANQSSQVQLSQARSVIQDLDFAKATAQIQSLNIQRQAQIQLLRYSQEASSRSLQLYS